MENGMIKRNVIVVFLLVFLCPGLWAGAHDLPVLDMAKASKFAAMALKCIHQQYPNKPGHVMMNEKEVLGPRALHPAFYGCFDWHSAVHGHWMLIRLLKTFPRLPEAPAIRKAINQNLTAANILKETEYFKHPKRKSFERTYGWAWLLKLAEELHTWDDPDGKTWLKNLTPLTNIIVKKYMDFLPKQTYPIRTGVHPNTAFGLAFALDYARTVKNKDLETLLTERALSYYAKDTDCPAAWEPGGEDFFSPCLMEAALMQRVLKREAFNDWFHAFLPGIAKGKPRRLLEPATVTDRSDGKLVHLDGLNLSRAWCMTRIASALPRGDARDHLLKAAVEHADDALKNIHSGDYAGEHWLASFAVYLLAAGGTAPFY